MSSNYITILKIFWSFLIAFKIIFCYNVVDFGGENMKLLEKIKKGAKRVWVDLKMRQKVLKMKL